MVVETSIFRIAPREAVVAREKLVAQSTLDDAIARLDQRIRHIGYSLKSVFWLAMTGESLPFVILNWVAMGPDISSGVSEKRYRSL